MENMKEFARKHGYVETIFGRRCYTPGVNDKNFARRGYGERQAINAPLQGSAADIIRRAMIRMLPALEKAGLAAKMLLQVHDELIFETPENEVEETCALVSKVMSKACEPAIKLNERL